MPAHDRIYTNLLDQAQKLYRHNRQLSYKSRDRYYAALKRFCAFLAEAYHLERLANIAPKHIRVYVRHLQQSGKSPSTIKTDLAAIRFWHDQLARPRHRLPQNEALALERRSFGKIDRAWSATELHKMMAVCWRHEREDYVAVLALARYAGLRIHECFRIDAATAEAAIKAMAITIKGKGGKVRTVPINATIRIELEKMLVVTPRGHKLFVPTRVQTHTAIQQLQQFIITHRASVQDADSTRPLTFHGLRHTYAQEQYLGLVQSGHTENDAKHQVSRLLGHNRPEVTRIYLAGLHETEDDHG